MQESQEDALSAQSTVSRPKSPVDNYSGLLEAESVTGLLYPPRLYTVLPAVPEDSTGNTLTWDDMRLSILPVSYTIQCLFMLFVSIQPQMLRIRMARSDTSTVQITPEAHGGLF